METGFPAGSPLPVSVNFVPAGASSGFAVSVVIVGDAVEGGAMGPGRGATPVSAGGTSGVDVAAASEGRSTAPASAAAATAIFVVSFMVATPSLTLTG